MTQVQTLYAVLNAKNIKHGSLATINVQTIFIITPKKSERAGLFSLYLSSTTNLFSDNYQINVFLLSVLSYNDFFRLQKST